MTDWGDASTGMGIKMYHGAEKANHKRTHRDDSDSVELTRAKLRNVYFRMAYRQNKANHETSEAKRETSRAREKDDKSCRISNFLFKKAHCGPGSVSLNNSSRPRSLGRPFWMYKIFHTQKKCLKVSSWLRTARNWSGPSNYFPIYSRIYTFNFSSSLIKFTEHSLVIRLVTLRVFSANPNLSICIIQS